MSGLVWLVKDFGLDLPKMQTGTNPASGGLAGYFRWHWWIFQGRYWDLEIWSAVSDIILITTLYKKLAEHILHNICLNIYRHLPIIGNIAQLVASISVGTNGYFNEQP